MKELEFSDKNTTQLYRDYMNRVRRMIKTLPAEDQKDLIMEFNSHIYESMQKRPAGSEIDGLLEIIERLGAPEETLISFVADKKLDQATKTFNPLHVAKALLLNLSNGISYVIFSVLYLFLFAFLFLIVAKLVFPENVGLFYGEKDFYLGMISPSVMDSSSVTEYLGGWFIPVMILCSVVLYFIITLLLKLKNQLKKERLIFYNP